MTTTILRYLLLSVLVSLPIFGQIPTISGTRINLEETDVFSPGTGQVAVRGSDLGQCEESDLGSSACAVTVAVQGKAASLLQVDPFQIRLNMPSDLIVGPANIVVTVQGVGSSQPFPVTIQQFSPVIHTNIFGQTFGTYGNGARGVDESHPANELDVVSFSVWGLGVAGSQGIARILLSEQGSASETEMPIKEFFTAGGVGGSAGFRFEIPCGFPAGSYQLAVEMSDPGTGFVARSTTRPLWVGGLGLARIENAASFNSETASPGAFLSVFGGGFGSSDGSNLFPSTEHEGLSFWLNGQPARLFAVIASACQVNLVVPNDLDVGDRRGKLTVTARRGSEESNVVLVNLAASDPGLFRFTPPGGETFAVATLANTAWLTLPDSVSLAAGIPVNCEQDGIHPAASCGRPARAGDAITLWLTGLGKATDDGTESGNTLSNDEASPADGSTLYRTVETPRVFFIDFDAQLAREGSVVFSGLSPGFFGLYQVNVIVPVGVPTGDSIFVQIETRGGVGGFPMSDQAQIAITQ